MWVAALWLPLVSTNGDACRGKRGEEDKEIRTFHPPVPSSIWSRSEVTSATLNTVPVTSGLLQGSKVTPCSMAGLLSLVMITGPSCCYSLGASMTLVGFLI